MLKVGACGGWKGVGVNAYRQMDGSIDGFIGHTKGNWRARFKCCLMELFFLLMKSDEKVSDDSAATASQIPGMN